MKANLYNWLSSLGSLSLSPCLSTLFPSFSHSYTNGKRERLPPLPVECSPPSGTAHPTVPAWKHSKHLEICAVPWPQLLPSGQMFLWLRALAKTNVMNGMRRPLCPREARSPASDPLGVIWHMLFWHPVWTARSCFTLPSPAVLLLSFLGAVGGFPN